MPSSEVHDKALLLSSNTAVSSIASVHAECLSLDAFVDEFDSWRQSRKTSFASDILRAFAISVNASYIIADALLYFCVHLFITQFNGRSRDFSTKEPKCRRRRVGRVWEEGFPFPHWRRVWGGGCAHYSGKKLIWYLDMAYFGAFWYALL